MLGVAYDAYQAATGHELPLTPRNLPATPEGEPWDEEEAAVRAPLLAIQAGYPLDGVRVVITGRLERYTRAAITELLQDMGATVQDSVTRQITLLIVGEAPGSKLARARSLGVKTVAEADFRRWLRRGQQA
jgi:DNA ligase (NAD+)